MKNKKFSLIEKLGLRIVKRYASDLKIEPSVEHPGLYDAYFEIDKWHAYILRILGPKAFHFADQE